jgi:uncharacterized phage protein gp47/JayE
MAEEYGILETGLNVPSITAIREEMEERARQKFGRGFPLGDLTFAGHQIGIVSEQLGLLWEIAEVAYSALDPDKSSGDPLRAVGLLTGTFELPPSASVVTLTLTGADSSLIPEGVQVSQSAGVRFSTVEPVTLVGLDAWVPETGYEVGDRVTNLSRCYQCIADGTSDASGGPNDTDEDEADSDVHWTYLGEGVAAADVIARSLDVGPIIAVARDLTTIETPVGGLESAINLLDATPGRDVMTDRDFRLLRESEITAQGTGPVDAVRSALLSLRDRGVRRVSMLFNNSDTTDSNGLPPHSVEALVTGGDDQLIWQTLWDNVPIGITYVGDEVGTVIDSEGRAQVIKFSRPVEKLIHVKVTLTKVTKSYLGDDAVKLAIASWGDTLELGDEVYAFATGARAATVTGVKNVTEVLISVDPVDPPVSAATLVMGVRDLPVFDTSRVTVVSTEE